MHICVYIYIYIYVGVTEMGLERESTGDFNGDIHGDMELNQQIFFGDSTIKPRAAVHDILRIPSPLKTPI